MIGRYRSGGGGGGGGGAHGGAATKHGREDRNSQVVPIP